MLIRIVVLSLLLALTGCSSMGDWFSSSEKPVAGSHIGNITDQTLFTEESISAALGPDYHLRSGMGMKNNELLSFYQASKQIEGQEKVAQIIYGKYDSGIVKVDVFETGVSTGEAAVGDMFDSIFPKAFGACELDNSGKTHDVICRSPTLNNVEYTFQGQWDGPQDLLPADDALKAWLVTRITWFKQAVADPDSDAVAEEYTMDKAELDKLIEQVTQAAESEVEQ